MSEPVGSEQSATERAKTQVFLPHLIELTRGMVPAMHPAGRPFVLGGALVTLLLRRLARPLGLLGMIGTGWIAWFFRVPRRVAPNERGVVAAAADGTVAEILRAHPPTELGLPTDPMLRISVFLSVFDVHVQRIPAAARIITIAYRPGKFLSADLDKASEDNERNSLLLRTPDGHNLVVTQIAGLVARRIVCEVAEGAQVRIGQTYGLIRFGSRVDVYVPTGATVRVRPGQRTIGGETVLAELPAAPEPAGT
ncbi:MAG: phosphatidylserine decarboxylase [Sciscionella sp.]